MGGGDSFGIFEKSYEGNWHEWKSCVNHVRCDFTISAIHCLLFTFCDETDFN